MLASDFKGKKTYLWGTGVEGQSIIKWWQENMGDQELGIIENNMVPSDVEIIIKSPGVSVYLPQSISARENGVKFTSLMNIFLANIKTQTKQPKLIGITGTKGKSTTSSLLAYMLEKMGYKVGLGGNIGSPPLDFLGGDYDYIVLELSSFQIYDIEHNLDYGLIVNISQAHVDWHQSLENYVNDKLRFKDIVDNLVVNGCDERLNKFENAEFYGTESGYYTKDGKVFNQTTELNIPELQIKGEHNLSNLCGCLAILDEIGLDYNNVLPSLSEFKALPHRLQLVHKTENYIFIDDSIATVPESTMAAINAFDTEIAVIVGGFDNTPDYTKLDEFIAKNDKVKIALCLPDTGRLIKNAKAVQVTNMDEAVKKAVEKIANGVILLSPAAPSFNLYANYKERGYDFARIAKEIL